MVSCKTFEYASSKFQGSEDDGVSPFLKKIAASPANHVDHGLRAIISSTIRTRLGFPNIAGRALFLPFAASSIIRALIISWIDSEKIRVFLSYGVRMA